MASDSMLTVFYDGACPLCRREIAFYQRKQGAERVRWVDVCDAGCAALPPQLSRSEALRRFHVRDEEGRLLSGGSAFAALWKALPGFRPLGLFFSAAPLTWILERAYRVFLRIRPRLQAIARVNEAGP